ncbi:DUF4041 domain-containing protein [Agreia bicolorata]|uniref:ATPase n=1 Tax=Agreia bicolorata TaxID=110935 RepID=A0ABR5CBV1_9MICO|nr:DUF4041 domain-containing protein [Agreia bicolorata]KJC63110.1 ATPase [Agreia bicolorata]
MSTPAGWYDDTNPNYIRWWDGEQWTEHVQQKTPLVTPAQPESRRQARQAAGTIEPAPLQIDKLSKNDARALASELMQRNLQLEELVEKHGLRPFGEIDAYRAEVMSDMERARRQHESDAQARAEEHERAWAATSAEMDVQRAKATRELQEINNQLLAAQNQLKQVRQDYIDTDAAVELQNVGFFEFEHPAQSSADLATELETVRYAIKQSIQNKRAVSTASGFTFNNSAAQGKKFMSDMAKVLLRAYNAEAENAIKATRAGNLAGAQTRLTKAAEQIAKSGTMISLHIEPHFHQLRLKEIALANQHLQVLAREKEMERDRRAELREQAKAAAELEREKERLNKEQAHYVATLAALQANGDLEGAARMQAKIEDVERAIADVDYRAANARAGYVYVISNVGAFGERMVKIGMTRRLEPMDRVNELGDASVPFRFDVHALFFADDAVAIEAMLHRTFAPQRVNKVNLRREFFYTTPDEVLQVLKSHAVEIVEYTVSPAAAEFRASSPEMATA